MKASDESPFPNTRKPVIGAINGVAVTGGLELVLNCDFLVASEHARFADTHARVGVQPGWGMTVLLPQAIGLRRAKEMSATGNYIDANTALSLGSGQPRGAPRRASALLPAAGGRHGLQRQRRGRRPCSRPTTKGPRPPRPRRGPWSLETPAGGWRREADAGRTSPSDVKPFRLAANRRRPDTSCRHRLPGSRPASHPVPSTGRDGTKGGGHGPGRRRPSNSSRGWPRAAPNRSRR